MKTQIVIFGITGDLAGRKLLPALQSIVTEGMGEALSIVGVSRRAVDLSELLQKEPELEPITSIHTMDLADAASYSGLRQVLEAARADQTLFYLSVPPGAAADIVDFLGQAGLNTPQYKVLFEKPFGYDLKSAEEFIERTARYYEEAQLYRIDHYMAKEISAELIAIRQNAENHHHHWSSQSVKAITIAATESIGIEGRAQFYEQTGALRDFIQGHLMQVLSLVLMRTPRATLLAPQRLHALEALKPVDPEHTLRAQYEGYQDEVENPGSQTETFVSIPLESTDPAWSGVTIHLITGKALHDKRSYVCIEYIDGTEDIFDEAELTQRDGRHLDAYERVLLEAIAGRKDIFTSSPEVIRSWQILAPLQQAWAMSDTALKSYPQGATVASVLSR